MSDLEEQLRKLSETHTRDVAQRDSEIGSLEGMLRETNEARAALEEQNRGLIERLAEYEKKPKVALVNVQTIQRPLLITDLNNEVTYASESFLKLTGYPLGEVVGKTASQILGGVDLRAEEASALGVERLPSRDTVIQTASGAKVPVTLDIFLNMTGDVNPYSGFTLIMEPTDRIHRLGIMFSHMLSRGNYHLVEAGKYAEGAKITNVKDFLPDCISILGTKAHPKKKAVVVSFDGVNWSDKQTLGHLANQHRFLDSKGYQMFVGGVEPGSEIYNGLAEVGFPTDYISREMPKKIQRSR